MNLLEALVGIGDDELDALEAPARQILEEARPEGLSFAGADVQADGLALALGVDGDGDYYRDTDDPATRWYGLSRFLDDGRVDLDSNTVERSIRSLALNRKNALFAGSDEGSDNWAVTATLIENCKLAGINPHAWLTQTLSKLANGLLPTPLANSCHRPTWVKTPLTHYDPLARTAGVYVVCTEDRAMSPDR